ncbi:MAG: hypothetical protein ACLPKT_16600 [Methylocella sp.]
MALGCRPLYEDRNARISILANGIAERPDTFVQTVHASITKPLADGAGHTFAPAAETWARTTVESNICTRCVSLIAAGASKKASKVPDRLKRQNRFQTLFQCPNFSGRAKAS